MKNFVKILLLLLFVLFVHQGFSQRGSRESTEDFLQKVRANDLEGVKVDLKARMDPNSKDTTPRNMTALIIAAQGNLPEMITLLVHSGARVNEQDAYHLTALKYAVFKNNQTAVLKLFEYGADPNIDHPVFGGAIQDAAIQGNTEIVRILLDHGAKINDQMKEKYTPLYWACNNGKVETVKLLIERGADVNAISKYGETPLMTAEARGHDDIIKILQSVKAKEYPTDLNFALIGATNLGHFKLVKELLKKGANVNTQFLGDYTPLLYACGHGDYGIYTTGLINMRITAKVLLDYGANPNVHSKEGMTPLIAAIQCNDAELVKLLFSKGVKIEPTLPGKNGALHHACLDWRDSFEIIKLLVEHGAPINEKGWDGITPLSIASQYGRANVVKYLLEHGADWRIKSETGRTALLIAKQNNHPEVVKILEEAGAKE